MSMLQRMKLIFVIQFCPISH